jgi:hypothetical protein
VYLASQTIEQVVNNVNGNIVPTDQDSDLYRLQALDTNYAIDLPDPASSSLGACTDG